MQKCKISYFDTITLEHLLVVWKEFLRGKRNRRDVADFQMRLVHNLSRLHYDLVHLNYTHYGYTPFNISDPKPRQIHKATVRDRVVHHLLYRMLYRHFDERFIYDSYSCRVNKGTHKALQRFRQFTLAESCNYTRTVWTLKCDIRKFFASIDHQILKRMLYESIDSPETLGLLENVIDSFHTEGKDGVGLPLGNLTSQLLVNVYMNKFDQFIKHRLKVKRYIRYADDFVVLSRDREYLITLLPKIRQFLHTELLLELHPKKVSITTFDSGIDFLGWVHFPHHRILRTTTKRRMFRTVTDNPKEEQINSYMGMLTHGNTHKLREKLPRFSR